MNVRDAATALGLSAASVRRELASGSLECCRVGPGRRRIWITDDQIAAYLDGRRSGGQGPARPRAPAPARTPSVAELRARWKAEGLLP